MPKKFWWVLIAVLLLTVMAAGCQKKILTKPLTYNGSGQAVSRFPGEFERQQAIWLMWPSEIYNSNDRPVNPVMVNIVKALAPNIRVNIMARDEQQIAEIKSLLTSNGVTSGNINYLVVYHQSVWARDVGPIFTRATDGRLQVADFGFNNYSRGGNQDYVGNEALVDKRAARLLGLPVITAAMISEGGAIESNGRGTLMTTESVILRRNPGLSKQQIAAEYNRVLGVKKVVWLKKGLAEDDQITTGHINEIARFADAHTVLLAQVLPGDRNTNQLAAESYRRMEENYKILQAATDQDGKPFKIIRIPMPPTLYQEANETGKMPVYSYLNYALTNKAVLVQTYWRPGRSETLRQTEEKVLAQFKQLFPGRQVIGINAENINRWGGGLHCVTQHMPASK